MPELANNERCGTHRSRIFRGLLPTLLGVMSIATFVAVYETLKDVRQPPTAFPFQSALLFPDPAFLHGGH